MFEKMNIAIKSLTDARFKRDIKAFKSAKIMYVFYAWEFLKRMNITPLLENGASVEEIARKKSIKNTYFLESLLDILVGSDVLEYKNKTYKFISAPEEYSGKNKEFLEKYYPQSIKWTEKLMLRAKDTLLSGKKPMDAGFDDDSSLDLWDGIMNESPYSFRNISIDNLLKNLKEDAYILDAGCGGGIDLEHILLKTKKRLNIVAVDASDRYLERAKARMKKIYNATESSIIKENIDRIEYLKADLIKDTSKLGEGKFDGVFMCLVLNHIPREKLPELIKNISKTLKKTGVLSIYQLVNISKFRRIPIWVMHTVPSHREYPYLDEYMKILKDNFKNVDTFANSTITIARNNYSEK